QMRHELFERRFEIYKKVQVFLSQIMQKGGVDLEFIPEFYDAMQKARFLFGEDVNKYLEEIKQHAFAERDADAKMHEIKDNRSERSKYASKKSEELKWLCDQIGQLHDKFGPYMNFSRK
ncbi:MAG: hypothetical protein ACREH3_06180, partial [Geminicoccales bacterium]